jgi:hypothetical protein
MALHLLPRDALPGPLQGPALCFGPWPLTHGFPLQHTGPTAASPGYDSRPVLLRASCSPAASGWRLLRRGTCAPEGCWRVLRSQCPWLTSVGRCSPPGVSAVQTGQYRGRPAPDPVPLGSSASAAGAGSRSRWRHHPCADAARSCLRDGIPGVRLPGAAVYPRFRPLRASRRPGGYAGTPAPGGRDAHPHGQLSYKVHTYLAVYPEASASFRPTGRTSTKAVLLCQPYGASTAWMASRVPNTTRCRTRTRRRRRMVLTTCA